MKRRKPPRMKLHELELFKWEVLDLLFLSKEDDPDISLPKICRSEGIPYEWVQLQAQKCETWADVVDSYEGLKKGVKSDHIQIKPVFFVDRHDDATRT